MDVPDPERLLRHLLEPASGSRLSQDEYGRDFAARLWLADGADSWKLERMQFYDEAGFPSWDAFAAGDWERACAGTAPPTGRPGCRPRSGRARPR
jgi:hypothetical protein